MNKKQLIIAAMAAVLSVTSASADPSNITGITGIPNPSGGNIFNIDPATVSGNVGYRHYNDFSLSEGDIANLIYQGIKNGDTRNIDAFINLVQNHIDVKGIVNTVRDGNFYNGHAIFISPNGMTVGASGVLNVGQLSVITPKQEKFNELTDAYNARTEAGYRTLNAVSKLRSDEATAQDASINYGGNAPVTIGGTVIARNGIDIRGSEVNSSGRMINGVNDSTLISSAQQAKDLFDTLVKSDDISTNASSIIIKSGKGADAQIFLSSGHIANKSNGGEVVVTNHGDKGLHSETVISSNGNLTLFNRAGDMYLGSTTISNTKGDINIVNDENTGSLTIFDNTDISAADNLHILNHGTGQISSDIQNTFNAGKMVNIVNEGQNGLYIGSVTKIGTNGNRPTSIRIVNRGGNLTFAGSAYAEESVSLRNEGAEGMSLRDFDESSGLGGYITAGKGILVHNKKGNLDIKGSLAVTDGDIAIKNEGNGKLTTANTSSIVNGTGNVAIKNEGAGGMELNGTIENEGQLAINNLAGAAVVNGTITNTGNTGIINKADGTGMTINATVNNEGDIKIVNSAGANGLTVNGTVNNKSGDLYVYNDAGHLTVNGTLNNTEAGNLYVLSRANSTGVTTAAGSAITNETGNLAIKHNGVGTKTVTDENNVAHNVGMDLNGTVTNSGEIAINNYTGEMNVAGTITQNGSANIGIVNRAAAEDRQKTSTGGTNMTVNATITGTNINIKNNGTGDMTVNGEITHNGRLNVLANEGNLILGGKIHNTGKDMTYAAARANGDGIDVKSTFEADADGGTILIKNITGQNGLNYEGTMTNKNGLAEVYNKTGDMTVKGAINAVGAVDREGKPGASAVVLNTGNGLTVTDAARLDGEVVIVNKGKNKANVADKYKNKLREQLKK